MNYIEIINDSYEWCKLTPCDNCPMNDDEKIFDLCHQINEDLEMLLEEYKYELYWDY